MEISIESDVTSAKAPFCLFLMLLFTGSQALRFNYFGVPGSVLEGDSVWLDCGYDLEKDALYSVKWYKDNYEFYRYLPSDYPPSRMLNLKGVYLDLARSNATHAYLKTTDLDTEGIYACEVSTDAPSFRTIKSEKKMRVYVLPDGGPIISGLLNKYFSGDLVNITCNFGPSKPVAKLKWFINNEAVPSSYLTSHVVMSGSGDQTIASVESRLRFYADSRHLWQGIIQIRCTAYLSQVYSESSEEIIIGEGLSSAEFQRSTAQAAPGKDAPHIVAGMSSYEVGDMVELNCTSSKSAYPADLHWTINEEEAKEEYLRRYQPISHADGHVSTRLGLKFILQEDNFGREEFRLKCSAILANIVELTTVKTVLSGHHRSLDFLHSSRGVVTVLPETFWIEPCGWISLVFSLLLPRLITR